MSNAALRLPLIVTLIGGVLVLLFFIFKPFLVVLTLAMISAIILNPLYKKLLVLLGHRKVLSVWVTLSIGVVGLIIPFIFLVTQLSHEALQVYISLSDESSRQHLVTSVMDKVGKGLGYFIPGAEVGLNAFSYNIDEYLKKAFMWLIDNLGLALSSVSTFLLDVLIFLIALYYCIKDGHALKKFIHTISPLGTIHDEAIFTKVQSAVNSIIKGNLLIAAAQGVFATIGFILFGVPNSILWGALTAIASLIPRIGTALIIIPAVIYLLITNSLLPALFLTLWGFGIVGAVDNILGPKLIGKELSLHPLSVLLSAVGGLLFFGPAGIFIGPLIVSFFVALVSVYADLNKEF